MRKIFIMISAALMLSSFFSCKSSSYASKTGQDVNNAAYVGDGGDTEIVVVKGIAQITSKGEQDAYDRAVAHAMREAVSKVLGTMVRSETLVENAKLVSDSIMSKSSGFVQRYTVLNDTKQGSTKIVEVKAWVVLGDVKKDAMALGLIQDRVGRPMVMVLVNEKSLSTKKQTDHSKNALQRKLMEKEFQFVDQGQLQKVLAARNIQVSKLVGVSKDDLAKIAVDAGAQILLKGTVNSSVQSVSSLPADWKSVRSVINIDVVYAGDASIIASSSANMAGVGISLDAAQTTSITKGIDSISKDLINKILKKWDNMVNNGFEYTLVIAGVEFADAGAIKSSLEKKVEGVKKVFQKGFNNNTLELLVRFSGNTGDLASMITAEGKMSVPLAVKSVNTKSITLVKK
jgi:hypothetical protein